MGIAGLSIPAFAAGPRAPSRAGFTVDTPDTSLDHFFGQMADSTDTYFGRTAAPRDTAGLDSSLDANLAAPARVKPFEKLHLDWSPVLRFNRVESGVYGAGFGFGRRREWGRLSGDLAYASGLKAGVGGGEWQLVRGTDERRWAFQVAGGKRTEVMDRVRPETVDDLAPWLGAATGGFDTRQFLSRSGFAVRAGRLMPTWRAAAGWRDELESGLDVHTFWNLAGAALLDSSNVRATRGRAREAAFSLWGRAPHLPIYGEISYRTSRRALGSDFEYRLMRIAAGADLGIGRWSALVPQVLYGRLTGDALPQGSFFLDRSRVLNTRLADPLGGSRIALGRLDWIGTRDVLALAHLPHPAMFPIQASGFTAAGAAWGADPFGGPSRPGGNWPDSNAWSSEAGFGLIWQSGIPDPTTMARFSVAWPLDGRPAVGHMTFTITRALFLVQPPDR